MNAHNNVPSPANAEEYVISSADAAPGRNRWLKPVLIALAVALFGGEASEWTEGDADAIEAALACHGAMISRASRIRRRSP